MQSHLVSYRRIREVSRCNAVKTANSGFRLACVLFILSRSNPITAQLEQPEKRVCGDPRQHILNLSKGIINRRVLHPMHKRNSVWSAAA
jgi:hypothetical protein